MLLLVTATMYSLRGETTTLSMSGAASWLADLPSILGHFKVPAFKILCNKRFSVFTYRSEHERFLILLHISYLVEPDWEFVQVDSSFLITAGH